MNLSIFHKQSLKTRVTLFTLAIFLTSIWGLAFYASHMLHKDMQRLLGDQQFSTVSILAAEINKQLNDRLRALETVAASVTPAMLGNPAGLQMLLEERPLLQNMFNAGTFATGLDGTVAASTPKWAGRIGINVMDRDHIIGAIRNGKATIGKPAYGKVLHVPTIVMAVPIRNKHGDVIGALAGVTNLNINNFLEQITESRYGKTGGLILVAREHRLVITATDKNRIMQPLPAPGINPAIDRFINGYEGYAVYVNQFGVEVLTSSMLIPVADWGFGASLPTEEAFAPIRDMEQRMLIATAFLTLLAGSLTWWMLRRQLAPLLAAVKTLTTLSNSNQTPQSLPISRPDEIGELIACFNRLLKTLGQREEEVRQLAYYDQLTQLPNRRLLDDRLSQTMATSKRSGKYAALMFLDLDNFKPLNDTRGHGVGDVLLIEAASRLKSCVREKDTVARFGGDEFVVMLNDLDTDKAVSTSQAKIVAEKIRVILSQPYLLAIRLEGKPDITVEHHCTASIGVALFINHEATEADVMKWADTAMYQAKEAGRNQIRFYAAENALH